MGVAEVAGAIGLGTGLIIGVAGAWSVMVRPAARAFKTLTDMREDWRGEPARDGVPGRPGVMARLAAHEAASQRVEAMLREHLESHRIALAASGWPQPRHRADNGYDPMVDPGMWRDHP